MQELNAYRGGLMVALTWVFLMVVPVTALGQKREPGQDAADSRVTDAADELPDIESCEMFGRELQRQVAAGQSYLLKQVFSRERAAIIASQGIDLPTRVINDFKRGLRRNQNLTQLIQSVMAADEYVFLRVHDVDGERRVLFRMSVANDGGLNYHDIIMSKHPHGHAQPHDIYLMSLGECYSEMIRRGLLALAATHDRSAVDKSSWEYAYIENLDAVNELSSALLGGAPQRALEVYNGLPKVLRDQKNLLLLRLTAASQCDEDEYKKALHALRSRFPNDGCIDLHSIDYFLLRKQFRKSIEAAQRLSDKIGGDVELELTKVAVLIEAEEYEEADTLLKKTIKQHPEHIDCFWTLVTLKLHEEEYAAVADALTHLESEFAIEFQDLTTFELYSGFVKSPEYKAWLKRASQVAETESE